MRWAKTPFWKTLVQFEKEQEKVTDVIIPPALEDMDKFEDDLLSPETARAKAIEAMTKELRAKLILYKTLRAIHYSF